MFLLRVYKSVGVHLLLIIEQELAVGNVLQMVLSQRVGLGNRLIMLAVFRGNIGFAMTLVIVVAAINQIVYVEHVDQVGLHGALVLQHVEPEHKAEKMVVVIVKLEIAILIVVQLMANVVPQQ